MGLFGTSSILAHSFDGDSPIKGQKKNFMLGICPKAHLGLCNNKEPGERCVPMRLESSRRRAGRKGEVAFQCGARSAQRKQLAAFPQTLLFTALCSPDSQVPGRTSRHGGHILVSLGAQGSVSASAEFR